MPNNLPVDFKRQLEQDLPVYAAMLISALENTDPSVSARLNPSKPVGDATVSVLSGAEESVAWCDYGRYFSSRPDFTHDPAFHQGCYYVQEASSMAIDRILRHIVPQLPIATGTHLRYLDACAAPGGKTTAAISALLDM